MQKYINRLFEEKNFDGLIDEEKRIKRIIDSYKQEMTDNLTIKDKERMDIINREEKLLEYIKEKKHKLGIILMQAKELEK